MSPRCASARSCDLISGLHVAYAARDFVTTIFLGRDALGVWDIDRQRLSPERLTANVAREHVRPSKLSAQSTGPKNGGEVTGLGNETERMQMSHGDKSRRVASA